MWQQSTMVDNNCIIEGNVKFRDGKKWKSRWCVMRKLSPVADCLHLQLYGDNKDKFKQGQTKASLSLQHFLGVESGFTLDKESNTIAIICQDLIVVLAFDTRERLIQWQVKISTNLGEDQQFLVIISSTPSKGKITNGPAQLHIQDSRFCLTVGVPPRLACVWEIGHLRRYGVVEGRFCFEGGSRCGRGEGLHVLITDQGDDIVKTLQLAAEGKLTTRKRPLGRELSVQDSPRRQFTRSDTRVSDFFPSTVYCSTTYKEHFVENGIKTNDTSPCWSSTESRHNQHLHQSELDGDYSCRESNSTTESTDQPESDWKSASLPRSSPAALEKCNNCTNKFNTITKLSNTSRSVNSSNSPVPSSSVSSSSSSSSSSTSSSNQQNNLIYHLQQPRAFDRLSLSSYSSSSHESDSSGPQNNLESTTPSTATHCKHSPSSQQDIPKISTSPSPTVLLPPRPDKPPLLAIKKRKKPPMPLPTNEQICTCKNKNQTTTRSKSGPYENYDIPRTILAHHMSLEPAAPQTDQYYDTPRKIKECLALPKNYPNYDTPQSTMIQKCGCHIITPTTSSTTTITTTTTTGGGGGGGGSTNNPKFTSRNSSGCPCHNIMSWAGFVLPYCRRGAGIEPTGVAVHPVKLSGEGKMPVVNASGELSIYSNNKKQYHNNNNNNNNNNSNHNNNNNNNNNNNSNFSSYITKDESDYSSSSQLLATNNYENIEPVIDTQPESKCEANYVNIDFSESLEHYENSRELIVKTGISQEEIVEISNELKREKLGDGDGDDDDEENKEVEGKEGNKGAIENEENKIKNYNEGKVGAEEQEVDEEEEELIDKVCNKCGHIKDNGVNYLLMDPDKQMMKKQFHSYLPMHPIHNISSSLSSSSSSSTSSGTTAGGVCSKEVISRICSGSNKSSSNPTLFGTNCLSIDVSKKRSDSELRIPGSAMLSSPYLRRRLIDPTHTNTNMNTTTSLEMLWRKRSYSAESTHYIEDHNFSSTVSIHKCSSETNKTSFIINNKDVQITTGTTSCTNSDSKINRDSDDTNSSNNTNNSQPFSIKIRRSSSVPSKTGHNRDSSSSNDSGVSLTHRNAELVELELSLTPNNIDSNNSPKIKQQQHQLQQQQSSILSAVCRKSPPPICYHSSLPRKSKSSDPLRDLSFQFQKIKIPTKSSSAEGEIPTCLPNNSKGFNSPGETSGTPYIDSRSTSSGTSDMSDYIETLSLSSHSSSDTPDSLRLGGRTATLRPRSGKEYYKLDRSILSERVASAASTPTPTTTSTSYVNIAPVLEKSESPSPGYMSSSPFEQPQTSTRDRFLFPEEA